MKIFHCDHCQQLVFFENTHCLKCNSTLAYSAPDGALVALEDSGDGVWRRRDTAADSSRYRLCRNYTRHNVCNWALSADTDEELCGSCRLTLVIPNLSQAGNRERWAKLETAKRRLIYTLLGLELPHTSKTDAPDHGLAFEFLSDTDDTGAKQVLTGHADGVITLNVAEADDAERERRRVELHEPYRTLLGHFRHEVGHYYWDRLIKSTPLHEPFRQIFGDERDDYSAALDTHYQQGPPADWQQRFISSYATSHPWEDWAETWAHYLHMIDTLETADACGMMLQPDRHDEPKLTTTQSAADSFDGLVRRWFPVTYVLNNLNRGLGLADAYPFVQSGPVIEKLRFVHDAVSGRGKQPGSGAGAEIV